MYYYGYGGASGYGQSSCGQSCGQPYPAYCYQNQGSFGSTAAIILVLFILLVIVIGTRVAL
ncbi:MAG: YjcZ family sporulation protein [Bacilli bacterium]